MRDYPQRLHHGTPGWVESEARFHVRIRIDSAQTTALTHSKLSNDLRTAAIRYHDLGHWWCELFLLMPDHLHALLRFPPNPGLIATVHNWKRGTARFQGVQWQDNFFDHRILSQKEAQGKWRYIRMNPVVKQLCVTEDDWPHWCSGSLGGTH